MRTIGIRVTPGGVTFAIYDTEQNELINVETIKIPKALSVPDALKYLRNNILDVLREYDVDCAGLRITESNSQSLNIRRIEMEGVIQESFASSTLSRYFCGQISSISSRIGIERAEFKPMVDGISNYEGVENWGELSKEAREAVLAAIGAQNA